MSLTKISKFARWVLLVGMLFLLLSLFFSCKDPVEGPILDEETDRDEGDTTDKDADSPIGQIYRTAPIWEYQNIGLYS